MINELITLVKLNTVHLYLDSKKKIIIFDVLNSNYSKNDSVTVLEYFKNFWILAKENNEKFFLIIKINSIGIYPLNFYTNLISYLTDLNDLFKEFLHSCAFLCNDSNPLIILKPLFNVYKFVRPYTICKNYEDILIFFNKNENQILLD
jgi:hypothetical protein